MLIDLRSAMPVLLTLMLALSPGFGLADDEPVADQDGPSGYMDPDDRSPAAALNPAESGPEVWVGPIIMGVFAFFLILLIRRYSKAWHQGKAQKDPNKDSD